MTMAGHGLIKLLEELGELSQVAAKKLAYMDTDTHPDGGEPLSKRLENEMADVTAAISFVAKTFSLDTARIDALVLEKLAQYIDWHKDRG